MRWPKWKPRPEAPRSRAVAISFCNDPRCGVHILALDEDDEPICETVMSREMTLELIKLCKADLYEKATERDDP